MVWNTTPEIFTIGSFAVRWYGLLFASSFLAGFFIIRWIFRQENKPEKDLDELLFYMITGIVIGARLGHCIFYDPEYYFSSPIRILKIWEGGLASHGAVIGVFLALYLYARKKKDQKYLWLLDRMAIVVALGGAFIRLGNLFNSEIIGKPATVAWAVIFTRVDIIPRHPAQLYESIAYLIVFFILMKIYLIKRRGAATKRSYRSSELTKKNCSKNKLLQNNSIKRNETAPGLLLGTFLVTVFSFRFLIEFLKENQSAFEAGMPLNMGQLLSLPLILIGVILLTKPQKED